MDSRLKLLSYSSLLTLHLCPRKFQLYRLSSKSESNDIDGYQNLTFAFGHAVGEGIQLVFQGKSEDEIIWTLFTKWYADLAAYNPKQQKSFYLAIAAIQRFISLRATGLLQEYEIVIYKGAPAVELSFRITLPDGYTHRGSVDVVLKHKITGKVLVVEVKTTSAANINPSDYKNSSQAVGYSVILDVIFPGLDSYEVVYPIYKTKSMEYEILRFSKSHLQKAQWIQELLLDIDTINLYENTRIYPMRGENCVQYYRDCEYMNLCTLSTEHLTVKESDPRVQKELEEERNKEYSVELTLADLLHSQINALDI